MHQNNSLKRSSMYFISNYIHVVSNQFRQENDTEIRDLRFERENWLVMKLEIACKGMN